MTQSTSIALSIPTAARGKVRAYIKGQPGFDAWIAKMAIDSRDVRNVHLVEYAEAHGLLPNVKAIIAKATGQKASPFATESLNEAVAEAYAANSKKVATMSTSAFTFDAVVADIDAFLSPVVRKSLENALLPVLDAANKPAVVTEKIVTVPAPLSAPAGSVPYAVKTGATLPFAKLFGVRTSLAFGQKPISLWEAHGLAPQVDPYFVVDAQVMAVLATAAEHETPVWMVGPSGSGKTSTPEQFAAYTGRPYVKVAFTKQTEVAELVGTTSAKDGTTFWEDGALIAAIRRPGTVILIDEPTVASAGVQMIIQNMTDDHRTYTIHATGEVVKVAPGVMFVIGDNTNGAGDETGQYAGTNQSNTSLVNRFKRMVRVDYLTKAQETSALVNHTRIPQAAAEHVVEFMQRARKLPEMEGVALSLRQMVGFVDMVKDGFGARYAFECAVLTRLPGTERAAIETMATLQWSEQFEQLLAGAPVTNAPSDTAAASAFDDEVSASLGR
jgi:cobaltochelatase CobS